VADRLVNIIARVTVTTASDAITDGSILMSDLGLNSIAGLKLVNWL